MIESVTWAHRFGQEMRRDTFHDHIAAEDDIFKPNRHMTRTMPGQMYDFKGTNTQVHGFIGEINRNGTIDGFCKTVDGEERFRFLFSESSFGEERSEASAGEREAGFMMRYHL